MTFEELAAQLRQLSRENKFRALHLLIIELARSEGISLPSSPIEADDESEYSADMVFALQQMLDAGSDDKPASEDNDEDGSALDD
jgi:hypothetical protein